MGATLQDRPGGGYTQADIAPAGDLRYIPLMPGALFGCIMSTAGSSTTLTVGAGYAADSTGVKVMRLASAMAKTTAAWVAGTTNGGLDTGAIAASTWYHWYVIYNPTSGAVDVLFSLSATAPTMPSGYTLFRRIGSMLTNGSSQWTKFTQLGDEFLWDVPVLDVNAVTPGVTTAVSRAVTVPTGLQVWALMALSIRDNTAAATCLYISSLDVSDQAASFTASHIVSGPTSQYSATTVTQRTSTSAQVRSRISSTTGFFNLTTFGWIDSRGKLQ